MDNNITLDQRNGAFLLNKRRKITSLACENCRVSHLKCDGASTCGNCKRKSLTCAYSESKRRGRKPTKSVKDVDYKNESEKFMKTSNYNSPSTNKSDEMNVRNESPSNKPDFICYSHTKIQTNSPTAQKISFDGDKNLDNHMYQYNSLENVKRSYPSLSSQNLMSQQQILENIMLTANMYTSYCKFLFPFIQISDPMVVLQYLSTPPNMFSKNDKIHYGGINAVLAIGSFLIRSDQQCDEFANISHNIGKEVAFDTYDITLSCAFSIFAYMSKIRDEKEKAELYIQYALSTCKLLNLLETEIGQIVLYMSTLISKYKRKERLQKLSKNPTSSIFNMISSIYLILHKCKHEINSVDKLFGILDDIDKEISFKHKDDYSSVEHLIIKLMTNISRSYAFMKKKRSDIAKDSAKFCLKALEENKSHIVYFPVHFVKLFFILYEVLHEYALADDIEKLKKLIVLLPYAKIISRKIEIFSKNVINVNNHNHNST